MPASCARARSALPREEPQSHGALAPAGREHEDEATAAVAARERVDPMDAAGVEDLSDHGKHLEIGDLVQQPGIGPVHHARVFLAVEYRQRTPKVVDVAMRALTVANVAGGGERGAHLGQSVEGRGCQDQLEPMIRRSAERCGCEPGEVPLDLHEQILVGAADVDPTTVDVEAC